MGPPSCGRVASRDPPTAASSALVRGLLGCPRPPPAGLPCAGVVERPPLLLETVTAPIKQKASFKIKDAKCHLHPRAKGKQDEAGKVGVQGEA